ncbi:MAG: GumC family protein [bacterium]
MPDAQKNITLFSLRDIIQPLFKYKTILILCIFSVSIPVSLYSFYRFKKSPLYEAYSKILIEQKNINTLLNSTYIQKYNFLDTEVEILYSRPVLNSVIKKPELQGLLKGGINDIVKGLSVIPGLKTNILKINFRHTEKDLVAPFVNTLTDEYIRRRYIINKDIASIATNFFEQEKEDISRELSEKREYLQNLKEEANLYSIEEQKRIYLRNLEDLNMRLSQLDTRVKVLEEKEKDISTELKKKKIEISPYLKNIPDVVSRLETILLDLELKKNERIKKFHKEDQEVKLISEQIDDVKKNLTERKRNVLSNELKKIELDIKDASLEKDSLTNQIEEYTEKIRNIEDKKIIIEEYDQTITELEERKANLIKSIYKVSESADIEQQGSISIYKIEEAITPKKPVEPRPVLYSLLGIIVGLFFGFIAITLLNFFDHSFQDISDVSDFLKLPLLATFQNLNRKLDPSAFLWKGSTEYEKSCKMVQNFFQNQNEKGMIKTIIFTGSMAGEGTTTIASNMATFLSASGNLSVLLIDGNLEAPFLHDLFHLSNKKGLADLLNGECGIDDVIKPTETKKLNVITSRNENKQIEIRKIGKIIEKVKANFDLIIIDCPPVLQSPDALNLCREADTVFYIIEADKTQVEVVQNAQAMLEKDGITINGVILNNKKAYIPAFIYRFL